MLTQKVQLCPAIAMTMDKNNLRHLFPTLEEPLFEEMMKHGTIKEVKAGETLLKVGQTIRSTMLILDGLVKL
ncbi:MAG: Crp/Fnr family transcriptional regulator, partial [Segetibacter sp.]|nr:Crp/Fnr family transcriptional regulator [Segetibacter sp.]